MRFKPRGGGAMADEDFVDISDDAAIEDGSSLPTFGRSVLDAFNPHIESKRKNSTPWAGFTAQFVLIAIAAVLYFGVRMVTKEAESAAFAHAEDLLRFERRAGLDIESWAQELIIGNEAIVTFFNWVYIWLHWPMVLGAFFWLYRYNKRGFVLFRNAMILSGAIGLVFFVTYPVAPPRFLDGFSDTVSDLSTSYKYLQPPSIVNKFAALPSLHVGWNLLVGVVLFQAIRQSPIRFLPLLSPVLMTMAVVFTANHFVVDALMGAAIALVALYGAKLMTDWTEKRAGERVANT
jgi:hypothetical protein